MTAYTLIKILLSDLNHPLRVNIGQPLSTFIDQNRNPSIFIICRTLLCNTTLALHMALLSVKNIGSRNLLQTLSHKSQLDLILNIFDINLATWLERFIEPLSNNLCNLIGSLLSLSLGLAGISRLNSVDNGFSDFLLIEVNQTSIALNNKVVTGL